MRKNKKVNNIPHVTAIAFCLFALIGMGLFFPPTGLGVIITFIFLTSIAIYLITVIFAPKKYGLLAATGVALFFTMSYIAGFQMLNTILLLSFIIGIGVLIHTTSSNSEQNE